jgi:hypothetical protein
MVVFHVLFHPNFISILVILCQWGRRRHRQHRTSRPLVLPSTAAAAAAPAQVGGTRERRRKTTMAAAPATGGPMSDHVVFG